ncbi:MAG: hypothetical protein MJZ34_04625, partial [Paludibacteraceae bacterium]|nr:hypothetical protein [Paludibacteraceae bacterium]
ITKNKALMTPFIYVVAPTFLTFGLPPSHLGNSSKLDCSRFVVGLRHGSMGVYIITKLHIYFQNCPFTDWTISRAKYDS